MEKRIEPMVHAAGAPRLPAETPDWSAVCAQPNAGAALAAVQGAGARPLTLSTLRACPDCGTSFPEPDPRLFSYNAKHGWCPDCYGTGLRLAGKVDNPDDLDLGEADAVSDETCPSCHGARLNPVARAVRFRELGLHELASLAVGQVAHFFGGLALTPREADIARDLVAEIRGRLDFLQQVGLAYLALGTPE